MPLVVTTSKSIHFISNHCSGCLSSVETFDFLKQQWEVVTHMNEGIRALNAVALPDGIYVLGGYNGKEYFKHSLKVGIHSF